MLTQRTKTEAGEIPSRPMSLLATGVEVEDSFSLVPTTSSARTLHREFTRHAVIHVIANLGALACSGALAFVLPRFLSVADYGYYRLFILYGSFAGILQLGFLDGLLLRWAARPVPRLRNELSSSLVFVTLEQLVILLPLLVVVALFLPAVYLWLVTATAAYALLWNWMALGQCALQGLKLFSQLSFFTILGPLVLLLAATGLHLVHRLDLQNLVFLCIASNCVACICQWLFVRRRVSGHRRKAINVMSRGFAYIGLGWSLVCANFLATVALSLDRLVLSRVFPIREFAIYSFAANALALTYNMILSLARVLFPYLSDGIPVATRIRAYFAGERILLLLWVGGLSTFFPIAWLINRWLPLYGASLPLIRILMLATGFTASIHVLHSTYFRVVRKQRRFLIGAFAGLASGALFLGIGARTGQLTHFAWAMVASALTWWLVNEYLLRDVLNHSARQIFAALGTTVICAIAFVICTSLFNLWLGFLIYLLWAVPLIIILARPLLRYLQLPWLRFLHQLPADNVSLQ